MAAHEDDEGDDHEHGAVLQHDSQSGANVGDDVEHAGEEGDARIAVHLGHGDHLRQEADADQHAGQDVAQHQRDPVDHVVGGVPEQLDKADRHSNHHGGVGEEQQRTHQGQVSDGLAFGRGPVIVHLNDNHGAEQGDGSLLEDGAQGLRGRDQSCRKNDTRDSLKPAHSRRITCGNN